MERRYNLLEEELGSNSFEPIADLRLYAQLGLAGQPASLPRTPKD